jgi:hypothetical protein
MSFTVICAITNGPFPRIKHINPYLYRTLFPAQT